LPQNVFHFAANRIAFCRKTHSILPQNASYFAAKCPSVLPQNTPAFCGKMEQDGFRLHGGKVRTNMNFLL